MQQEPIRIAQVIGKMAAGGVENVVYNYYRTVDHAKVQFDFFVDEDSTASFPQDLEKMCICSAGLSDSFSLFKKAACAVQRKSLHHCARTYQYLMHFSAVCSLACRCAGAHLSQPFHSALG